MQLLPLLLALVASTPTLCDIATIIPIDPLPCTPSPSPNTCLLNYQTNRPSTPSSTTTPPKDWITAYVYSPACQVWGQKTLDLPGVATFYNWGLSRKYPLLLSAEKLDGVEWHTPRFYYDGVTYTGEDCACREVGEGGFLCACPFRCKPFPVE